MNEYTLKRYAKENPRRDVAVVGLRDKVGNVLLMRTHSLPEVWTPIGGGIEPDDASPAATVIRELYEEFGVQLDDRDLTEVLVTPYDFGEGSIHYFETKVDGENLKLQVDTHEVEEYRWFSMEETKSLAVMPATQKFLRQIAK